MLHTTRYTLHATRLPNLTMSSSSTHSNSGSSSHSDSSHSDTFLQLGSIIEEHPKGTLPYSADALLPHEDTLLHLAENLPHPADTPSPLLHEAARSKMPPRNRSGGRDVHIFDTGDRSTSIGGLILTEGITNANLYTMIEIFVLFNGEYVLRNESGITIKKDSSPLPPGNYYIDSLRMSLPNSFFL
jgi:hypothetical protein